jgi:hypothetical protein
MLHLLLNLCLLCCQTIKLTSLWLQISLCPQL